MFLSQGVDYLGFLNAKLRDLEGWSTLANELIQNADDAGATRIVLDVTSAALVVCNDAQFSDCGSVESSRCAWDPIGDGKKCCDFHAFRRVASGHKRMEEDTTGAFGIGFISVYQITDYPDLRSGRWHWRLDPAAGEERRIFAEQTADAIEETRFTLPWAQEQTQLRSALGRAAVSADVVTTMSQELRIALLRAAPFLKRLSLLELRVNGALALQVECDREVSSGDILVVADGAARVWKRVTAEFNVGAAALRQRFGSRIEDKRKATVTVGVPLDEAPEHGLLYASLPTEHQVELPVLINADFFPSTNRKLILFDKDYQGAWNRAAIGAAAKAFATALPQLRDNLPPTGLWHLLSRCRALHDAAENGAADESFKSFWALAKPVVQSGKMVWSSRGAFCLPVDARINGASKEAVECLPLFEALGLNIVHNDLRLHYNVLREVGVPELDLDTLAAALRKANLGEPVALDAAPAWLRNPDHRHTLAQVIEALLDRQPKDKLPAVRQRLSDCSLWLTVQGELAPASRLWYANEATRTLVRPINADDMWLDDASPPELLNLVDKFDLGGLAQVLEQAGSDAIRAASRTQPGWIRDLIAWIDDHHTQFGQTQGLASRIRAVAIWPSGGALRPLEGLSVPGNFADPLNLAQLLDASVGAAFRSLIVTHLGAKELDLRTYLIDHVPAAFSADPKPEAETRRSLIRLLARHIGEIRADEGVRLALRTLPLVECEDGDFRSPHLLYLRSPELISVFGDVRSRYVHSVTAGTSGVTDALHWLGVHLTPEPIDILARVDSILASASDTARDTMRSLFRGLADFWPQLVARSADLRELKAKSWLPANKVSGWQSPPKLFTVFRAFLFQSQAQFLDIPLSVQAAAQQRPSPDKESLIEFLGIRGEPTCAMVVDHLLHEAREGAKVNLEVFTFLELHHNDNAITRLYSQSCLPVEGGFIKPGQALRTTHGFGRFRYRLGPEWLRFSKLLDALGVGAEPTIADAVSVLEELAGNYSADRRQLSTGDKDVALACWSMLSGEVNGQPPEWVSRLSPLPVVANARDFLHQPAHVYFEDRPGLATRFDETVQNYTIRRPEMAWVAMAAAGVRDLSKVVEVRVVECLDPQVSERWSSVLRNRWPLVRRVMSSLPDASSSAAPAEPPEIWDTSGLKVCYSLGERVTPAEDAAAVLDPHSSRLYVVRDRKGAESAVARELAFMMRPDAGAGLLAAALKELLAAGSIFEAAAALSDLGFADVVLGEQSGGGEAPEVGLDSNPADSNGGEQVDGTDSNAGEGLPPGGGTVAGDLSTPAQDPNQTGHPDNSGRPGPSGGSGTGRPTNRGASNSGKPSRKTKFVGKSFVQPAREAEELSTETAGNERQLEVDRRGTEQVMAFELQKGRLPRKMGHFNEGYDIESLDADGSIERYIEVKSLSAGWDMSNVGLSAPQFQMAREEGARFWLYVVDSLDSTKPGLHLIQDPASMVVEYRFDDGWKQAARSVLAPAERSTSAAVAPKQADTVDGDPLAEAGEAV
jgi:hypothetical protein